MEIHFKRSTIQGLHTTFFTREASEAVADSMLQQCRFFGPLLEDIDLISIHMNRNLEERFQQIAYHDSQLRGSKTHARRRC